MLRFLGKIRDAILYAGLFIWGLFAGLAIILLPIVMVVGSVYLLNLML